MTYKETMPEEIWIVDDETPYYYEGYLEMDMPVNPVKYFRVDTAISKKALIELLEGKRNTVFKPDDDSFRNGYNALIDELIKEIE